MANAGPRRGDTEGNREGLGESWTARDQRLSCLLRTRAGPGALRLAQHVTEVLPLSRRTAAFFGVQFAETAN